MLPQKQRQAPICPRQSESVLDLQSPPWLYKVGFVSHVRALCVLEGPTRRAGHLAKPLSAQRLDHVEDPLQHRHVQIAQTLSAAHAHTPR